MIDRLAAHELLHRWWFHYDEGHFEELEKLLTDDVEFSCRTDTGKTAYEDFVRFHARGRDAVMKWQREHRLASPHPLRHNGTNIHVEAERGQELTLASYLFVTEIRQGAPAALSTAICRATARFEAGGPKLARLELVLDTRDSQPLASR